MNKFVVTMNESPEIEPKMACCFAESWIERCLSESENKRYSSHTSLGNVSNDESKYTQFFIEDHRFLLPLSQGNAVEAAFRLESIHSPRWGIIRRKCQLHWLKVQFCIYK